MRRTAFALILILLCLPLFAERVGTFDFSAYYELATPGEEYLSLEVFEAETGSAVGYNGYANVTEQDLSSATDVFTWRLSSNTEKQVTLVFAISPLQAEVDSIYYIPKHKFVLSVTGYEFDSILETEYALQIYTDYSVHNMEFQYKESGDRPYPGNYGNLWKGQDTKYSGQSTKTTLCQYQYTDYGSTSNWRAIDSTLVDLYRSDWVLEGKCTLAVLSADTLSGNVDYVSNINVEVSVE